MNRFEQHQKHWYHRIGIILPLAAFLLLFILFLRGIHAVSATTYEKQQESLETALTRSLSQCYAVEGTYPTSIEYLEEHYGLIIDRDSFLVDYDYYGGNLLPDVNVMRKKKQ